MHRIVIYIRVLLDYRLSADAESRSCVIYVNNLHDDFDDTRIANWSETLSLLRTRTYTHTHTLSHPHTLALSLSLSLFVNIYNLIISIATLCSVYSSSSVNTSILHKPFFSFLVVSPYHPRSPHDSPISLRVYLYCKEKMAHVREDRSVLSSPCYDDSRSVYYLKIALVTLSTVLPNSEIAFYDPNNFVVAGRPEETHTA